MQWTVYSWSMICFFFYHRGLSAKQFIMIDTLYIGKWLHKEINVIFVKMSPYHANYYFDRTFPAPSSFSFGSFCNPTGKLINRYKRWTVCCRILVYKWNDFSLRDKKKKFSRVLEVAPNLTLFLATGQTKSVCILMT